MTVTCIVGFDVESVPDRVPHGSFLREMIRLCRSTEDIQFWAHYHPPGWHDPWKRQQEATEAIESGSKRRCSIATSSVSRCKASVGADQVRGEEFGEG